MGESRVKIGGFARNAYSRVSFEQRPGQREKVSLLEGKEKGTFHGPPPLVKGIDYVNVGEEDQMEIFGYVEDKLRTVLTWIAIVCTAFLLRLVFHWKPEWMLYCTHVKSTLDKAKKLLLKNHYSQFYVEEVRVIASGETLGKVRTPRDEILNLLAEKNLKLVLPTPDGLFVDINSVRFFENKSCLYIWETANNEFVKLRGLEAMPCSFFYNQKGLSADEELRRRAIFGPNNIKVPVMSIIKLLFLEVLNPFYVFQLFSVCLWYADEYTYYASCIVVMSAVSIGATVLQTRTNQKALRNTVQSSDVVNVWHGSSDYETISSDNLVPGDVIVIPSHGCMMHCDAVLVSGNCIVNESTLTGESVPITKTPVPNVVALHSQQDITYNPKEHGKHTLFAGTKVIQTRYYGSEKVKAVVIRTGFMTSKGELVRSIMYPKPLDFKFQQDSYRFIGVLFGISIIGFLYTVISKALKGTAASNIALDALDLITIVVPPALPAAMTVGIAYAQARLRKCNIYCISPRAINISGCINCVCFDKTGTLTEDGLDMWGVVPCEDRVFQPSVRDCSTLEQTPLLVGLATCHSLTIIEGQLSGDPLDLKMFESTSWILEEPEIDETNKFDIITPTVVRPSQQALTTVEKMEQMDKPVWEIGIVRQFTFSSSLQRMSVITRALGASHFEIYTKGSPEMIASLCLPETVPFDFMEVLMTYTQHGYRVLALATKPLPKVTYAKVQRISREQVECKLNFLGLLVMENRLKPETTAIIKMLKKAAIRTVMITGDNMLTALSVARDCEMIEKNHRVILVTTSRSPKDKSHLIHFTYAEMPEKQMKLEVEYLAKLNSTAVFMEEPEERFHFAMTGKSYAVIRDFFPELMPKLVVRGTVFARMSPDQKKQLVEHLQELGYFVGMCGDGANDCGALKAAHAGLSLSEAEASVASPFTSKDPNISCVPNLIREGRSALVTSFGIFKYMACYSFTQFVSVMILYSIESNLTDMEFLYIDLFIITLLAALFGRTEPYPALVQKQPPSSLISITPLASIALQMLVMISVQVFAFFFVQQQPWYSPFIPKNSDDLECYENYSVFAVSVFQYITLAVVFSKGAPYRRTVFSNYLFLLSLFVLTALTLYIIIYPNEWLMTRLQLKVPAFIEYRLLLAGVAAVNFAVCLLCESFIVGHLLFRVCHKKCRFMQTTFQYMHIEKDIQNSPDWPPVTKEASSEFQALTGSPHEHLAVPTIPILSNDEDDNMLVVLPDKLDLGGDAGEVEGGDTAHHADVPFSPSVMVSAPSPTSSSPNGSLPSASLGSSQPSVTGSPYRALNGAAFKTISPSNGPMNGWTDMEDFGPAVNNIDVCSSDIEPLSPRRCSSRLSSTELQPVASSPNSLSSPSYFSSHVVVGSADNSSLSSSLDPSPKKMAELSQQYNPAGVKSLSSSPVVIALNTILPNGDAGGLNEERTSPSSHLPSTNM